MCWMGNLSAQVQHFTWQGMDREYIIRTPEEHEGPLPVLFFLHGLKGFATSYDQRFSCPQMAEEYGWAIVIPQALDLGMGAMWNVGFTDSDVDDAGFLMALLDTLTVQYQLDLDSVFFTGFSIGGFMTHRMAIEHGDRITACAPVSGLISYAQASEIPVAPVRMLHIHGADDYIVGYNGNSTFFTIPIGIGVDSIMDYWQNANGCEDPLLAIDTFPDLQNDGLRFIRYTYNCETDLQLLKVLGGKHEWYADSELYDVDYMDVIYDFFTKGAYADSTSVPELGAMRVWPNPTNGILNIQITESQSPVTEIQVFDMYGKLVDVIVGANNDSPAQATQIDLSRFPDGVYFVQAGNGAVAKVVLARRKG